MNKHKCGCVTDKAILKVPCPAALRIREELDWAAEHGYEDARQYWVDKYRQHVWQ